MKQIEVQLEEPLRYESSVVDDAGLLLSPLDNLIYEMSYKLTTFNRYDESAMMGDSDIVELIRESKIPKEDVLNAIIGKPTLKALYGENTDVFKHLNSL